MQAYSYALLQRLTRNFVFFKRDAFFQIDSTCTRITDLCYTFFHLIPSNISSFTVNYPHQWVVQKKPEIKVTDDESGSQLNDAQSLHKRNQLPPIKVKRRSSRNTQLCCSVLFIYIFQLLSQFFYLKSFKNVYFNVSENPQHVVYS